MTQKEIRQMVKECSYVEFGEHKDLKGLCVCGEDFGYDADFEELVFIVPTDWLMEQVEMDADELTEWLNYEYTSDDSMQIFDSAILERKIVMVDFN